MKKIILFLAFLLLNKSLNAQTIYTELDGPAGEKRQLKIQLPRNYERNEDKSYPVIVVLDGDYLFEPVAGIADYYSYWDEMPDVIVVGIKQNNFKEADFLCDELNGLPVDSGSDFFQFVTYDLFNYLENNYRIASFKTIVGHGESANFLNFFLFLEKPFFDSYISLSPNFTPKMDMRLSEQLSALETPIFYSLTTSEDDRKRNKNNIIELNKSLESIPNENFNYNYNFYKEKTHYELVNHAIPSAFEKTYKTFKPIDVKEYKEKMLTLTEGNAYDYLVNKYKIINDMYGVNKKIRVNDFNAAEACLNKSEDWEGFKFLGKLAEEEYPESMLGMYYMGIHYENTDEPKKALKAYQSAFAKEEIGRLTTDDMLNHVELIKAEYGL